MNMSAVTPIDEQRSSPRIIDADDPDAFNHCFADVNGIRMHYVDEGQGPLVILLHGFPYLWYMWQAPDSGLGRSRLSRRRPRSTGIWANRSARCHRSL